jgi:hypothetical protein
MRILPLFNFNYVCCFTVSLVDFYAQGRPVNSNREAACFIAKLGGTKFMQKFAKSGGGAGLCVKHSYNRITLLWHHCNICFMVLGGMDAPVYAALMQPMTFARQTFILLFGA